MIHEEAIPITLDRPRHLLYTLRASKLLTARLREIELLDVPEDEKGVERALAEVWAGLIHEDPGLTVAHLEEILTASDLLRAQRSVLAAYNKQTSKADGDASTPPVASES